MKKLPKAIIFDWDNTIIDTWPLIHEAIDETMVIMGKEPWGLEKVKKNISKSMRESFPKMFGDDWQKAGEIYRNKYHETNLDNLVPLPNALELIDLAVKLGITVFVVSNKMGPTLRDEAEELGIKDKFFNVIGAHDASYDKPSKEPVELALEGSDIDPKKDLIWFLGDSYIDIECGLNSNCKPVLFGQQDLLSSDLLRRVKEKTGEDLLHFKTHEEIIRYLK